MELTPEQITALVRKAVDTRLLEVWRQIETREKAFRDECLASIHHVRDDVTKTAQSATEAVARTVAELGEQMKGLSAFDPDAVATSCLPNLKALVDAAADRLSDQAKAHTDRLMQDVDRALTDLTARIDVKTADAIAGMGERFDERVKQVRADNLDMIGLKLEALASQNEARIVKAIAEIPRPRDGRDGVMPVVVPWVEGKDVPACALVTHAGGLWQAMRNTTDSPAATSKSWELIADGVSDLSVGKSGDRELTVSVRMASGETRQFALPFESVVIDRGVFRADKSYESGDGVTHGGSYWICQRADPGVPGTSDGWRLAVRKGRDAK